LQSPIKRQSEDPKTVLKSIRETQKLFIIKGIEGGQVDIEISKHLLSLPENKQIEVLTNRLEDLRKDLVRHEEPGFKDSNGKDDDIDKAQLQILIEVIEGLLSRV